ncbi:hypothetical protein DIZ76_015361 [Coccidioides immitis]|nr:hypothetical protein DIZ76_015361 [Coccidioides immitis]
MNEDISSFVDVLCRARASAKAKAKGAWFLEAYYLRDNEVELRTGIVNGPYAWVLYQGKGIWNSCPFP